MSENVIFERVYRASLRDGWALWTTPAGFASWWGPRGFRVEVQALDGREGGAVRYDMIAESPEMIAAMASMGRPGSTATRGRFAVCEPMRRLVLVHRIDFRPGVEPYEAAIEARFDEVDGRVRMVVEVEPHPDPAFTGMAIEGFTSQLGRLDERFGRGMVQKVAFTMFAVEDTARARAFYEGVLGLRVGSHSDNGVWTEYDLPGGGCLALFHRPDGGGGRPGSGGAAIAFEVENLEEALAAVKAAGGTVQAEGITSPVCRMAMVQDTEGNGIVLHKLHPRP